MRYTKPDYLYKRKWVKRTVELADIVGHAFAKVFFRRDEWIDSPQRIVVYKPDFIGDMVLALPVFHALRDRFPQACIAVACSGAGMQVLKGSPLVDVVVPVEPFWLGANRRLVPTWSDIIAYLRTAHALRKLRPDWFLVLREDPFGNALAWASRASVRAGYANAGGGFFLTRVATYDRVDLPQTEINRRLLEAVHAEWQRPNNSLMLTDAERARARSLLEAERLSSQGPIILIHPGASDPRRRWAPERFGELIQRLSVTGARVYLIGGDGDREIAASIVDNAAGLPVGDLTGSTSVRETVALIELSDIVICHDSSAAHLGAASQTKAVVLFSGITHKERWEPYSPLAQVLHRNLKCAPCFTGCADMSCMDFSVDEVSDAVQSLLAGVQNDEPVCTGI